MTSISRLSGITAIALGAALSMTAGLALAGEVVSADQISKALQSKPLTRGLSAGQQQIDAVAQASLKGSTFVVAGHTDAVVGEEYNQGLSERRADTIKRYLTEKYGINGSDLVTVGYGKTKPKDANAPMDPVNRRVQVVNMETKTATSQ